MKKLKIYFYYWFASLFFLLLSFYWLSSGNPAIDINVHDTYYVIHNSHASILLVIIYAFLGLIYCIPRFTKVKFIRSFTNIHSILTLGIVLIYFVGYFILKTRKHSQFPLFDDTTSLNGFMFMIWLIFLISQIFLVLNLIISLAKLLIKKK